MSWFSRKEEPQPKEEVESNPIDESLDTMNRLQAYGRSRDLSTRVIADDAMTTEQRKLLHEYDVIPVIDQKTGKWKLFS